MIIKRYDCKLKKIDVFERYVIDPDGFCRIIDSCWNNALNVNPSLNDLSSNFSLYYLSMLMLFKRVAMVQSSVLGRDVIRDLIINSIPDFELPGPIALYLQTIGLVNLEDGVCLYPDLATVNVADGISRCRYLHDWNEKIGGDDISRIVPILDAVSVLKHALDPGEPEHHLPKAEDAPDDVKDFDFSSVGSKPFRFAGNFTWRPEWNVRDANSDYLENSFELSPSLLRTCRAQLTYINCLYHCAYPVVSLLGDLSVTCYSRLTDESSSVYGYRSLVGFSHKAASLFMVRQARQNAVGVSRLSDKDYSRLSSVPGTRFLGVIPNIGSYHDKFVTSFFK